MQFYFNQNKFFLQHPLKNEIRIIIIHSNSVFPGIANNNYHGSQIVPIVFGIISLISLIRSLIHVFKHDGGAQSIATIPLDRYPKPASDTIVLMFAYWGISQTLMSLVYGVILWKYRNMLPFACLLFTIEWSLRLVIPYVTNKGSSTDQTAPGGIGNMIMPGLGLFLLYLSI